MSSANSYLSSTAYHASNARYARSTSPSTNGSTGPTSNLSSFNIRSANVQQPLNDLNSTRSSASTCSTSHCLSHQCLECTTILSTRPFQNRCQFNSLIDSTSNASHFNPTNGYLVTTTLDHHSTIANNDELSLSSRRILSMNIPVDNSNNLQSNSNPLQASPLNIEIEEDDRDEDQIEIIHHDDELSEVHVEQVVQQPQQQQQSQRYPLFTAYPEDNEQLEVFVGFYRPGEYERENIEDDDQSDDDISEHSQRLDSQKKEEQSMRALISDQDEGNEDQDFIDEDFGPNQEEDNDVASAQVLPNVIIEDILPPSENVIFLNANILEQEQIDDNEPLPLPMVGIQSDEDEDQGFGAQFNDDCQSSDDENNHVSTISLNDQVDREESDDDQTLICTKKTPYPRSQSDSQLCRRAFTTFLSLPNLSLHSRNSFEKIEHIIIDDQQPATTMSNLIVKKKQDDDSECVLSEKKKFLRKSSEEILEISNDEISSTFIVEDAVRDVERHVMLWSDQLARQMDNQTSYEQILQHFQLNTDHHPERPSSKILSTRNDSLLNYLHYRSVTDVSASELNDILRQHPDFAARIHSRFFAFWPPRDVDLLQWLTHWIKQNALPIAIMNMDHHVSRHSHHASWQHRVIYGIEPRGIYLMNPLQIQTPQQLYEQLTVDSICSITRQEIIQRYNEHPIALTALATDNNHSKLFSDRRWRKMNVLGQVVNVLREDRQSEENETRNIPYRPTVTHVRIPSTCSSGIFIFSQDIQQLNNANELPLRH